MIMITCENCYHWNEIDEKSGRCSRYPPNATSQLIPKGMSGILGQQKMAVDKMELMTWARTLRTESCGEFKNDQS